NASLGEMISELSKAGVSVPGGFATTADAFREFIRYNQLDDKINQLLSALDIEDVEALAATGKTIRKWVTEASLPTDLEQAIAIAYQELSAESTDKVAVAVRSSATAEDLPDASFAGQQETYLNVSGIDDVLSAVKMVFASLYNDRAIAYRVHQGFKHEDVALSAGIQCMVRSDIGSAGVIFTLDTESGFDEVIFITSSYGLGEMVVQGAVNPDEFYVHKGNLEQRRPAILSRALGSKLIKLVYSEASNENVVKVDVHEHDQHQFSLNDTQIESLARQALTIERHYGRPMDIEWGLDGVDGRLYILQARPETVESRVDRTRVERFQLDEEGPVLVQGRAIGQRIGAGVAKVIESAAEMARVEEGDVLITDMTDPDWEPVMKRASAIVTNRGGRTCHAAIIARELGIPAVVGCGDATNKIRDGQPVTVSCAAGDDGFIYEGLLKHTVSYGDIEHLPELPVKIMMNLANPHSAFGFSRIPNAGIGLARLEFIINTTIGVHPRALLEFDNLPEALQTQIKARMAGYADPVSFYVEKLAEGIATLAAGFRDKPVIVRLSDFKSNEYANLLGGSLYEPEEENPMIGFRGAARYISEAFRPCFELECRALKRVREEQGFSNLEIMIPFVRTLDEASQVIKLLKANGLQRGRHGLRIIMMCELPSNAVLAKKFLHHFDGFSIGSNDLTQLTLGMDRDSALIAQGFDERDPAVKKMLSLAIKACQNEGKYVGICGQGPSDFPDLAEWLMQEGISSISLNPDTVVDTWNKLAASRRQ
ncbi:MAG: phosphoenolpyruvate synthase, partial [Pseudomonadota bacterium]